MLRALTIGTLVLGTMATAAQAQAQRQTQAVRGPQAVAPAADPARQQAAERAVAALVPEGIYARMMRDQFPMMMEATMGSAAGLTGRDLGIEGADGDRTVDESATAADPHWRERMRVVTRVMGEEMAPVFAEVEPRVRAGLAQSFARRFTTAQLVDMNAFFATPSGKAFADSYLLSFMDPELISEMSAAAPRFIAAMPAISARIERETAHLPQAQRDAPDSQSEEE